MTYPRLILTTWLLALLLACALAYDMAHAGQWAVDAKGGVSWLMPTTPDGTYYQEAFPHKTQPVAIAYAVGLSYQVTPQWSVQAHWLNLGTVTLKGQAVADEDYDYKQMRCKANCGTPYSFKAKDSLQGVDLTGTYTWAGNTIKPYVKGGLALFYHKAQFMNQNGAVDNFNGFIPELELGAGLAYQWAYIEVDYFQGMNFGGQNLPISTRQAVLFAGVAVPLW